MGLVSRSILTISLLASLVGLLSVGARAASAPQFIVYNTGDYSIVALNIEPSASPDWGPDLLGSDVTLDPGYNVHPLRGLSLPSCIQDIRAVYEDFHVETMYKVNVCIYNVTFSY